jgi:hypothetical protein
MGEQQQEQDSVEADVTGNATGGQAAQNGGAPAAMAKAAVSFATEEEFQKRVDDMLKERLERERRKAEEKAQKAREQAEAEAAAKNGEWQKLAEQRAARLMEVEPALAEAAGKAERYAQALEVQLAALRKDVPKSLLALLDKLDVVEQLTWLAANPEAVKTALNGVPASPKAAGSLTDAQQTEARQQMARLYQDF